MPCCFNNAAGRCCNNCAAIPLLPLPCFQPTAAILMLPSPCCTPRAAIRLLHMPCCCPIAAIIMLLSHAAIVMLLSPQACPSHRCNCQAAIAMLPYQCHCPAAIALLQTRQPAEILFAACNHFRNTIAALTMLHSVAAGTLQSPCCNSVAASTMLQSCCQLQSAAVIVFNHAAAITLLQYSCYHPHAAAILIRAAILMLQLHAANSLLQLSCCMQSGQCSPAAATPAAVDQAAIPLLPLPCRSSTAANALLQSSCWRCNRAAANACCVHYAVSAMPQSRCSAATAMLHRHAAIAVM